MPTFGKVSLSDLKCKFVKIIDVCNNTKLCTSVLSIIYPPWNLCWGPTVQLWHWMKHKTSSLNLLLISIWTWINTVFHCAKPSYGSKSCSWKLLNLKKKCSWQETNKSRLSICRKVDFICKETNIKSRSTWKEEHLKRRRWCDVHLTSQLMKEGKRKKEKWNYTIKKYWRNLFIYYFFTTMPLPSTLMEAASSPEPLCYAVSISAN